MAFHISHIVNRYRGEQAMEQRQLRVAFLLGPGGFGGAWIITFLFHLIKLCYRRGYEVVFIGGVSVGAVIAAFLARAKTIQQLLFECACGVKLFRAIGDKGPPFSLLHVLRHLFSSHLTSDRPFDDLLAGRTYGGRPLDGKAVTESPIGWAASHKDCDTGQHCVTTNWQPACRENPDLIVKGVRKSAAMPGFRQAIDGGEEDGELPMAQATEKNEKNEKPDVLFVLLPFPKKKRAKKKHHWLVQRFLNWWRNWWLGRILAHAGHLLDRLIESNLREAKKDQEILRLQGKPWTLILEYYMGEPPPDFTGSHWNAKTRELHKVLRQGRKEAIAAIPEIERILGEHFPAMA